MDNKNSDTEQTLDDLCRQKDCKGHLHFDLNVKYYICDVCDKKYDNGFLFEHVPRGFWMGKNNSSSIDSNLSSLSNKNREKFRKLRAIDHQLIRGAAWKQYLKKIRYSKDKNGERISYIWEEKSKDLSELQKCELIVDLEKKLNLPERVITDTLYERKLWTSACRLFSSYKIFKEKGEHIRNSWLALTKNNPVNGSSIKLANVINTIASTKKINEDPYNISQVLKYLGLSKSGNFALNDVKRFKEMQFLDTLLDNYDLSTDWKICKHSEELSAISGNKFKPRLIMKYIYERENKVDGYTSFNYTQYLIAKEIPKILKKDNVKTVNELSLILKKNKRYIIYAIKMLEEENYIQTHKDIFEQSGNCLYAYIPNKQIFDKIPDFIVIKNAINCSVHTSDVSKLLNVPMDVGFTKIKKLIKTEYLTSITLNHGGSTGKKYAPTQKAIDFYESICKK
jgi:hypothetical protein